MLDSYDRADVVVVVQAVSVEKVGPELTAPKGHMSNGKNYVDGVRSTTMRVEQVFKGNLKVGDRMIFAQGGGADCIWTFNEESVDKEFLFYLNTFKRSNGVWIAVTCGRSSSAKYATDDLLYLQNMQKLRGRTRISGTLSFWSESDSSLADRTIRIIGADKSYEVKTDRDGVYEIYDLPGGKYLIEPEIPAGWRVNSFLLGYSASFAGTDRDKALSRIPIVLESGKHAPLISTSNLIQRFKAQSMICPAIPWIAFVSSSCLLILMLRTLPILELVPGKGDSFGLKLFRREVMCWS